MKHNRIAIYIAIAVAVTGTACFFGLRFYLDRYAGNFSEKYVLYVYPDMPYSEVMDSLYAGPGALRQGSLRRCARSEGMSGKVKPGRYVITPETSAIYAVRMLCNGWQTPQNLTLSGSIRSRSRLADIVSRQMMVDSVVVDSLLHDDAFLSAYGVSAETVFSLILPDTYQMYWTASPEAIFARFRKEYDAFWNAERLGLAEKQGLNPLEVSIIASIVNGETRTASEYPVIAGVYLNRLRCGMRLQADPTIAFCFDYKPDRILKKHLEVDSPYNTYKYKGLPPAPINVPPKACIDAVLNPQTHDYLYFCASPEFNGTHRFAVSYTEHRANARAFQKELTRRQREKCKGV
jgi:hypothetical protein